MRSKFTIMTTLYLDFMSQPSRACAIFIRANSLPVSLEQVLIHKGQTKGQAYRQKNPLGKVPFLEDGNLSLPESGAILTHLARKHASSLPDHWYPICAESRAMVEAGMHWYHNSIRAGCARLVFNTVLAPKLGVPSVKAYAEEGLQILTLALSQLEAYWLQGGKRTFMAGHQVSLADLLCCCELEQLTMMRKDKHGTDLQDQLKDRPIVTTWMTSVAQACGPAYEATHQMLRKAAGGKGSKPNSKL